MLKIVTLPFNERTEEFEQGKLERILGNVQIVKYQAELVKIEGKYYWTAFVEYEKAENIDKNLEKNNFLQNGKYIEEVNKNHEEYLSEEGYDIKYGARPLKGVIRGKLRRPLAKKIVAGEFHEGDIVSVTLKNGELHWEKQKI